MKKYLFLIFCIFIITTSCSVNTNRIFIPPIHIQFPLVSVPQQTTTTTELSTTTTTVATTIATTTTIPLYLKNSNLVALDFLDGFLSFNYLSPCQQYKDVSPYASSSFLQSYQNNCQNNINSLTTQQKIAYKETIHSTVTQETTLSNPPNNIQFVSNATYIEANVVTKIQTTSNTTTATSIHTVELIQQPNGVWQVIGYN